jgi:general secretion pathway protein H
MIDREQGFHADSGASLLELLIVLAILALAAAMMAPNVRNPARTIELDAFGRTFVSQLRATRAEAILLGRDRSIDVDVQRRTFLSGATGRVVQWPADVSVTLTAARRIAGAGQQEQIVFYPDGSSTGGRLVLQRSGRILAVSVEWLTGHARIEGSK